MDGQILKEGTEYLLGSQVLTHYEKTRQIHRGHAKSRATQKLPTRSPPPRAGLSPFLTPPLPSNPPRRAGNSDLSL